MPSKRTTPPARYADRIKRVREAMADHKLDGYLAQNRMDQFWLTGFTGEDGAVLLTAKQIVLLTDGRFDETADREAPYAKKVLRKKRGPETTAAEIKRFRLDRIGFNPDHMNVREFTELRKALRPASLVSTTGLIADQRLLKDKHEIAAIRRAIDVAQRAFVKIQKWVRPGLLEREVAAKLVHEMQNLGAQGPSFPPIVASGPNASLPHYEPGDRKLRDGEPLLIDWGARVDWYCSDLTRMLWLGSIPPRIAKINDIVYEAHQRAIARIRPGLTAGAIDGVARRVIRDAGFGPRFNHSLGHGLGLDVHDGPGLGRKSDQILQAGMVVTVEPGIYLPGVGGVRLESDVLVTESGCEMLSDLSLERPR